MCINQAREIVAFRVEKFDKIETANNLPAIIFEFGPFFHNNTAKRFDFATDFSYLFSVFCVHVHDGNSGNKLLPRKTRLAAGKFSFSMVLIEVKKILKASTIIHKMEIFAI